MQFNDRAFSLSAVYSGGVACRIHCRRTLGLGVRVLCAACDRYGRVVSHHVS